MNVETPKIKIPNISQRKVMSSFSKIETMTTERMFRRTKSGYDKNGRRFLPYAPVTLKYKREMAVSTGSRVSLMDSGDMLNSLKGRLISNGVIIYVGYHANIGYYYQNGMGVKKREWFGGDKTLEKNIRKELNDNIKGQLKNVKN